MYHVGMQQSVTPKEVSKAGDVSDVDAVRPEPQSLSLVPLSAENSAADSAAMALPEPEMLAPGDPSHSSSCSNLSDTLMHCRHSKMQYSVCLLHVCCQQDSITGLSQFTKSAEYCKFPCWGHSEAIRGNGPFNLPL